MTEARYLDDSSVRRFDARVTRSLGDRVALEGTHFYPEGGGQPHDTGILRADGQEWRVTDVKRKDAIYHTLDGEAPPEGTRVVGELDWARRHAHMRYHTAQHLLSALLLEEYDAPTRGNQLYADRARIDVAHGRFADDDLAAIEDAMNDLVADARPVTWYTLDREAAEARLDPERTRLDLLPASITEVRIVDVEGYDRTACAGTHVEYTDAVGEVRVLGRETGGKGRERLSFELR
jgi:misacylated tRNA(Ala) deacylase